MAANESPASITALIAARVQTLRGRNATDPAAVDRGRLRLTAALQPDATPLDSHERVTLLALLGALEIAARVSADPLEDTTSKASMLAVLTDAHLRALAQLGGAR